MGKEIFSAAKFGRSDMPIEDVEKLEKQYQVLVAEVDELRKVHEQETDSDKKKKVGVKINTLNRKINALKKQIKFDRLRDTKMVTEYFRTAAGKMLTKVMYGQILNEANMLLDNPSHIPKMINVFTENELKIIEKGKILEEESAVLKKKIIAARKIISDLMPNFIGHIEKDDYDAKVRLQKTLTKILKEL